MRAKNNSDIEVCVSNLLKTFRTEVPYAREKGIRNESLSLPADEVEQQLNEDAEECVYEYEPRVDIDNVEMLAVNDEGSYTYSVRLIPSDVQNG